MKPRNKPVAVKWAKVKCDQRGVHKVWIGGAIVGWQPSYEVAILRAEAANLEISRLVEARDRRLRRKGGAS